MIADYALFLVGAILVNNFVLVQFLGLCPFMGVSNKLETAMGMSMRQKAAVLFEESTPSSNPVEGHFAESSFTILEEEIEVAFLKEKMQRSAS